VLIVVSIYFVTDSVRKLLDMPSYTGEHNTEESEIRTHNPSVRAVQDIKRLRPYGHWDH